MPKPRRLHLTLFHVQTSGIDYDSLGHLKHQGRTASGVALIKAGIRHDILVVQYLYFYGYNSDNNVTYDCIHMRVGGMGSRERRR
jgi:hypothetical protein